MRKGPAPTNSQQIESLVGVPEVPGPWVPVYCFQMPQGHSSTFSHSADASPAASRLLATGQEQDQASDPSLLAIPPLPPHSYPGSLPQENS